MMQVLRNVISGGEPSAHLHNYASHFLTKEEKRSMIKDAGIVDIGPGEGLQVVGKIITQEIIQYIMQHLIHVHVGCHPCLYCDIHKDDMKIPLSVRGYSPKCLRRSPTTVG